MAESFPLSVLITGASSGIGAALAREFAKLGHDVGLAARRIDRLEALAAEIRAGGRRALALPCDVTRDGELESAVSACRREFGKIDVVVANAGFGVTGKIADLTLDDFRRQFETNVFGVLRTLHASIGDLERSRGRFAIIGSVASFVATPGSAPYGMSKFAVRALADSLRAELARTGVSVTLIAPGFVESEIYKVDNRGVLHEGAESPVPAWIRMQTPRAARRIARAIVRRRAEAVVTLHGKLAVFFSRACPWLLRAIFKRAAGRIRARSADVRPD